jgi:homopolymeric O-antigen transport system ATP-binding protein
MKPLVTFEGVWKRFWCGERHDSLRDLLPSLARWIVRRDIDSAADRYFWALRDVSFEVAAGEAFGIIGPNGAGKSTTLKLLTRILKPTRGASSVRGRVGALIEVAAGFHPDLTGRENVFLQGAIMGMKRAEIDRKLDDIVDFAGVSKFIDTPVKRYSSGMNARLGFAIAAHLDPDVLIIDEVLSVGDMAFQDRCVKRMVEFKRQGVAIVFVSHNLQAVTMLCERALFIRNEVAAIGDTHNVVKTYMQQAQSRLLDESNKDFVLKYSELVTSVGRVEGLSPGTPMVLRATFESRRDTKDPTFCLVVYRSTDLLPVYNANFTAEEVGARDVRAGQDITLEFRFNANLARGMYQVECVVIDTPTQTFLNSVWPLASFSVDESRTWGGIADLAVTASARYELPSRIA